MVLLLILVLGLAYQSVASAVERHVYLPPGRLVDIGGVSLHIYCTGERLNGLPAVILESGLTVASWGWAWVQKQVSRFTLVCSYDRAGYAWSEFGIPPRTAQQEVAELHELLTAAGIQAPYILTGSSVGGLHILLYAHQYPKEVAGLVFADAADFDNSSSMAGFFRVVSWAAQFGLLRGLYQALPLPPIPEIRHLPPEVRKPARSFMVASKDWVTTADEEAAWGENIAAERAVGSLGNLPIVVLTAAKVGYVHKGLEWLLPKEASGAVEINAHLQAQRDLAARSLNNFHIICKTCTHLGLLMEEAQAENVVEAIQQVISMWRNLP
jgi:pimeloyl-ACP methyl ester carboxylesterase